MPTLIPSGAENKMDCVWIHTARVSEELHFGR
jgi:hypothetical protein